MYFKDNGLVLEERGNFEFCTDLSIGYLDCFLVFLVLCLFFREGREDGKDWLEVERIFLLEWLKDFGSLR